MDMKSIFTWASVAIQLVAALLWLYATVAKVDATKFSKENTIDGWEPAQIVNSANNSDVMATAELQTYWNRWAALATALGVAAMAIATALPNEAL